MPYMNNLKDNHHLQLQLKKSLPKELRNVLYTILKTTAFPVLVTDTTFNILSANPPFISLSGYEAESLREKPVTGILHALDLLSLQKSLNAGPALSAIPVVLIEAGGRQVRMILYSDMAEKEGVRVNLLYFLPESAVRSMPGGGLRFSDELQEAGKTGLFFIDIKKQRFFGSPVCFKLLGITTRSGYIELSKITGLIYKKEDRERIERFLNAPESVHDFFESEFRIRIRGEGVKITKTFRMISCVKLEREMPKIHGFLRDISAEKKVEKELIRARNKAVSANRFKSVFLTNLSHELRTPMNAIIGFSELIKNEHTGSANTEDYLAIIKSKGDYLLSLVDDVIELSRLESGTITFNKTSFQLKPFMMDLYGEFEKRKAEKEKNHIELVLDIPEECTEQVIYSDPGRLHQVLGSILSNALKFTEKGRVEFGFGMSSKYFKFYVSDSGIGLSNDDQRRIFNRFEEIEDKALSKLGGTGLSLTIARKIVDQLDGKIKVRSELNKGSWFQISIPNETPPKKKTEMTNEPGRISEINWKDKVVLIAEDEELNFRFLEAVLQKTQAKVLRAKNGKEAIELSKKIPQIDIILMDIKMPVMNGNDATIEIKKDRPGLPIIAQTAFSVNEEIAKCKEAGCDDYITKPIDIKLLVRKIGRFFQA